MLELGVAIVSGVLRGISAMWDTAWGRIALIGFAAFLFGLYQGAGFMSNRIASLKKQHAVELKQRLDDRDVEWQSKLKQAVEQHEQNMREAIRARDSAPTPTTNSDLEQLCRGRTTGTDCRSAKRN